MCSNADVVEFRIAPGPSTDGHRLYGVRPPFWFLFGKRSMRSRQLLERPGTFAPYMQERVSSELFVVLSAGRFTNPWISDPPCVLAWIEGEKPFLASEHYLRDPWRALHSQRIFLLREMLLGVIFRGNRRGLPAIKSHSFSFFLLFLLLPPRCTYSFPDCARDFEGNQHGAPGLDSQKDWLLRAGYGNVSYGTIEGSDEFAAMWYYGEVSINLGE